MQNVKGISQLVVSINETVRDLGRLSPNHGGWRTHTPGRQSLCGEIYCGKGREWEKEGKGERRERKGGQSGLLGSRGERQRYRRLERKRKRCKEAESQRERGMAERNRKDKEEEGVGGVEPFKRIVAHHTTGQDTACYAHRGNALCQVP